MIKFDPEWLHNNKIYDYLLEQEDELLNNKPKFIIYNDKPNDQVENNLIAVFNKPRYLNYKICEFKHKSEEIIYFLPFIYEDDNYGVGTILRKYDNYIILEYDNNDIIVKEIKRNQFITKHPIDTCIDIKKNYDKGFQKKKTFKNYNEFIQMSTAILIDDYSTARYDGNFFNINEFDYEKYGVLCEFDGKIISFKLKNNPFPLIEPSQRYLNKYIKLNYITLIRNYWINKCYILKKED